jgi:hypothetical protein
MHPRSALPPRFASKALLFAFRARRDDPDGARAGDSPGTRVSIPAFSGWLFLLTAGLSALGCISSSGAGGTGGSSTSSSSTGSGGAGGSSTTSSSGTGSSSTTTSGSGSSSTSGSSSGNGGTGGDASSTSSSGSGGSASSTSSSGSGGTGGGGAGGGLGTCVTSMGGAGTLDFPGVPSPSVAPYPTNVILADLNGDGQPDRVSTLVALGVAVVQLNLGNGTFAPAVQYPAGSITFSVTAADLNGDGNLDLALPNNDWSFGAGNVSVLINLGNGTFGAPIRYAVSLNPHSDPFSVAAPDVNGDGKLDLAVANCGLGTVSVRLNLGNGNFGTVSSYAVGSNPYFIVEADVNGDGKPDLAVANSTSNSVSVLLNQGNGTFAAAVNYTAGMGPHAVAAADLNGDGKPDLAVANLDSASVSVLLNLGNGTYAAAVDYAVGLSPDAVAAMDSNGDGMLDLALSSYSTNQVTVLLGSCSRTTTDTARGM